MAKRRFDWPGDKKGKVHSRPFGKRARERAKRQARAKAKPKFKTITLKKAPPGYYDIGLDAQERAARRGLRQLTEDIAPKVGTQNVRARRDLILSGIETGRQRRELNEDVTTERAGVERSYGQTMADLLRSEQEVQRGYQRLGTQQSQAIQAAGLAEGGAGLQAAGKRAANQAWDIAPINVNRQRTTQQRQLSLDDLLRQQQRGQQGLTRQAGATGLAYNREAQDRSTQLKRAREEMGAFASDLTKTRMQSYLEAGGRRQRKVPIKTYRKWKRRGII